MEVRCVINGCAVYTCMLAARLLFVSRAAVGHRMFLDP